MIYRILLTISCVFLLFFIELAPISARSDEQKAVLLSGSSLKNLINEKKSVRIDEEKKSREEIEDKNPQEEDLGRNISATGVTNSGNTTDSNANERRRVEIRLKRDINAYIIESYKAQGNKIIKDLNMKLSKTIPQSEERKFALEKIQESLKSRLEKTEEMGASESKKEILQEFLKHLIQLLDKRIDEIEK